MRIIIVVFQKRRGMLPGVLFARIVMAILSKKNSHYVVFVFPFKALICIRVVTVQIYIPALSA